MDLRFCHRLRGPAPQHPRPSEPILGGGVDATNAMCSALRPGDMAPTSCPPRLTCPLRGVKSPAKDRSKVDFPAPLRPNMTRLPPGDNSRFSGPTPAVGVDQFEVAHHQLCFTHSRAPVLPAEPKGPLPMINKSTTGAPTKLSTALSGTPAQRTTPSAKRAKAPPVSTTDHSILLWRPEIPVALTRCGVANPKKAMGPHQAVTKPASTPAVPSALQVSLRSSTPMVRAVKEPMVHMSN